MPFPWQVKLQKGEATSEAPPVAAAAAPQAPSPGPEPEDIDDQTIKGRTKSINEQLSHVGENKLTE